MCPCLPRMPVPVCVAGGLCCDFGWSPLSYLPWISAHHTISLCKVPQITFITCYSLMPTSHPRGNHCNVTDLVVLILRLVSVHVPSGYVRGISLFFH